MLFLQLIRHEIFLINILTIYKNELAVLKKNKK
jgi:hypothetical protein